ncbi:MAG: N-ATPase subunit AtpR [Gammaproteobacteria bacterium]
MSDLITEMTMAFFAGALSGGLYFGGLWLTVRQTANCRQPSLGIAVSLLFRLVILAIILYWMADGHWQRYLAAVPGFLAARWWWIRRIDPSERSNR